MEKSAWNRLTLPNLPENSSSWSLYPRGWNRVHTALSRQHDIDSSKHRALLHQELVLLLCQSHQAVELGQVDREWFLAQDVLSSGQGSLCVLVVKVVRSTNVNRVYVLGRVSTNRPQCRNSWTHGSVVDSVVRSIALDLVDCAVRDAPSPWFRLSLEFLDELVGGFGGTRADSYEFVLNVTDVSS